MLQKTAAFEKCFQKCQQHKGQSMSSWLRKRIQEWNDLIDLTENTMMSEDLKIFFEACLIERTKSEASVVGQPGRLPPSRKVASTRRKASANGQRKLDTSTSPTTRNSAKFVDESEILEKIENYEEIHDPEELFDLKFGGAQNNCSAGTKIGCLRPSWAVGWKYMRLWQVRSCSRP